MTTKQPQQTSPEVRPLILGVGVYVPYDFDGPECAAIRLTPDVLREIARLRDLVVKHELHYATVYRYGAVAWGEQNAARNEYWNVRDDELYVTEGGFYFRAYPKHCDFTVETQTIAHTELRTLLAANPAGGAVVVGDIEREALVRGGLFGMVEVGALPEATTA